MKIITYPNIKINRYSIDAYGNVFNNVTQNNLKSV